MVPKKLIFVLLFSTLKVSILAEQTAATPTAEQLLGKYAIPISQDKVNCFLGLNQFQNVHFANSDIFMYIHNFNTFVRTGNDKNFPKIPSLLKFKIMDDAYLVEELKKSQTLLRSCFNLNPEGKINMKYFEDVATLLVQEKTKNPKQFVNYSIIPFKSKAEKQETNAIKKGFKAVVNSPKNFRTAVWKKFSSNKDIELSVNSQRIRIPNEGSILEPRYFRDSRIINFSFLKKIGDELQNGTTIQDHEKVDLRAYLQANKDQNLIVNKVLNNVLFSYAFFDAKWTDFYKQTTDMIHQGQKGKKSKQNKWKRN